MRERILTHLISWAIMSVIILPFLLASFLIVGSWDELLPILLRFVAFMIWIFVLGEIHVAVTGNKP